MASLKLNPPAQAVLAAASPEERASLLEALGRIAERPTKPGVGYLVSKSFAAEYTRDAESLIVEQICRVGLGR